MKRMFTISTSVALLCSLAIPAMAMFNPTAVGNRISRRLLGDKTRAEQRVPVGEVETSVLLRERKKATTDTSGFSNLSRSRITTRVHTLRGASVGRAMPGRPSRRSIIDDVESMLILPPLLVQTGGAETTVRKITRRTLIEMTEQANQVKVGW